MLLTCSEMYFKLPIIGNANNIGFANTGLIGIVYSYSLIHGCSPCWSILKTQHLVVRLVCWVQT